MTGRKREAVKRKKMESSHESRKRPKEIASDDRPLCKYGKLCYQKNPQHLIKFQHPHRENVERSSESSCSSSPESRQETKSEDIFKPVKGVLSQENAGGSSSESLRSASLTSNRETDSEEISKTAKDVSSNNKMTSIDDEECLPSSPVDISQNVKQKFLVDMPQDFYEFWEFCKDLFPDSPRDALKDILQLELVGPYQLIDGSLKCHERKQSEYLTAWRFYYDPPEFQTIIIGDKATGFHIGYFRDDPNESGTFVASNTESLNCVITPLADNIFAALRHFIADKMKNCDPFRKSNFIALSTKLKDWAHTKNIPYQAPHCERMMKSRSKKVVAKTFFGCGIVVPYDKKTQVGYRPIPETESNLKKILNAIVESHDAAEQDKNFDPLQALVNFVQYANDEMDYGMGLELGLDLFAFGGESLHSTVEHLLSVAYELLGRTEFTTILKAHLKNRHHLSKIKDEEVGKKGGKK